MLRNYGRFAGRYLLKDLPFTVLNLLGLSAGLACTILLYWWVRSEQSMDGFHTHGPQLYQVMGHIQLPDGLHTQENTPGLLASELRRDRPEITHSVSVQPVQGANILLVGEQRGKVKAQYVGSDFFRMFSYHLLQGNKEQPFPNKQSVLLSDKLALQYFHTTQGLLGKTIQWEGDTIPYTIAGIFEQPPVTSSARFDLLFDYQLFLDKRSWMRDWENSSPETYILVKAGTDVPRLDGQLRGYLQTKSKTAPLSLSLRKYTGKYLYNVYENGIQAGGRIAYVRLFSLVAVFIVLLACINFMNLSTAKAGQRAKELGIRKVAGASRKELVIQLLGESLLMAFGALLLSMLWIALLLAPFNAITGKSFSFHWDPGFLAAIGVITIITGLVAGSYPAFYLSRFRPAAILKGKLPHSPLEAPFRKGLVVFQFTISAVFIVAVLVVYRQMKMVTTINLGYNKEHIIAFRNDRALARSIQPFLTELKSIPGVVQAATMQGNMAGQVSGSTEYVGWEGKQAGQQLLMTDLDMDEECFDLLGLKMAAGQSFTQYKGADSTAIILNQAAVQAMGLKDPVGKQFKVWGVDYRIIGVAKDFHFESLYKPIKPCFIRWQPGGSTIFVKVAAPEQSATIARIGQLYQQYRNGLPLEYSFIDADYQALYVSEQRVADLSRYFAAFAVLLSCLGLFGLAAFTAQKRQKEIGIRKVVGASVWQVIVLLTADFGKLVGLAMLIAFPLSWWMMQEWLQGFAYHVRLQPATWLYAGLALLFFTGVAVGFQSIRAAIANPVKSLRSE